MKSPPGDLSAFFAAGGAVGLAPAAIRAMTLAEFAAVMDGFGRFHGANDDDAGETRARFLDLLAAELAAGRA